MHATTVTIRLQDTCSIYDLIFGNDGAQDTDGRPLINAEIVSVVLEDAPPRSPLPPIFVAPEA